MHVKQLVAFIKVRERARLAKEWDGERVEHNLDPIKVQQDPIISLYRFCNVRREDDRVTKFVRQWCARWAGDKNQWFCFVVARLFNNEATLTDIVKWVIPFKPEPMRAKLHERQRNGFKNFNAAYIVSTNGVAMDKVDYLIDHVLTPIWAARKNLRFKSSLGEWHGRLTAHKGMGSFIAAQVIADAKYEDPALKATDWRTFAASGPGSRRGLNRVCGFPVAQPWKEDEWYDKLHDLYEQLLPRLPEYLQHDLHCQDLQNCLCEYDKYERARTGEGRPKQKYVPHEEK